MMNLIGPWMLRLIWLSPKCQLSAFQAVSVDAEQQQSDWARSPSVIHVLLQKPARGASSIATAEGTAEPRAWPQKQLIMCFFGITPQGASSVMKRPVNNTLTAPERRLSSREACETKSILFHLKSDLLQPGTELPSEPETYSGLLQVVRGLLDSCASVPEKDEPCE